MQTGASQDSLDVEEELPVVLKVENCNAAFVLPHFGQAMASPSSVAAGFSRPLDCAVARTSFSYRALHSSQTYS